MCSRWLVNQSRPSYINWIFFWVRIILYWSLYLDLALNNLQRLICHKTQTTNQPEIVWEICVCRFFIYIWKATCKHTGEEQYFCELFESKFLQIPLEKPYMNILDKNLFFFFFFFFLTQFVNFFYEFHFERHATQTEEQVSKVHKLKFSQNSSLKIYLETLTKWTSYTSLWKIQMWTYIKEKSFYCKVQIENYICKHILRRKPVIGLFVDQHFYL